MHYKIFMEGLSFKRHYDKEFVIAATICASPFSLQVHLLNLRSSEPHFAVLQFVHEASGIYKQGKKIDEMK